MKILFVAEVSSIHTARWINQLKSTGWDIHVFQAVIPDYGVSDEFKSGTLHLPYPRVTPEGVYKKLTVPENRYIRFAISYLHPASLRSLHVRSLKNLIDKLQPDVVHSLGINVNWNNICLPVLEARRLLGEEFKAPWIYSSWGTDLDFYAQQSEKHQREVEAVLQACDYHITECERDKRLAREMGFQGQFAGYLPAFGGVTWDPQVLCEPGPVSARKTILLKGRDDPRIGRAMTAMKAFAHCQDVLAEYRIVIAQASKAVANEAATLSATSDLQIQVLPYLPYEALLRIIGASRLLVALTVNDGLPSTLVEAISLGAFPVHSGLESIQEWIRDGENGLLVPPEDHESVAGAIRRALTDDELVDRAAEINAQIVQEHLTDEVVRPKVIEMYKRVASQGPVRPRD